MLGTDDSLRKIIKPKFVKKHVEIPLVHTANLNSKVNVPIIKKVVNSRNKLLSPTNSLESQGKKVTFNIINSSKMNKKIKHNIYFP